MSTRSRLVRGLDRSGHLAIDHSVLARNPSLGFETPGYPGIFYLGAGPPLVSGSTLTAPESDASTAAIAALLALAMRARCGSRRSRAR